MAGQIAEKDTQIHSLQDEKNTLQQKFDSIQAENATLQQKLQVNFTVQDVPSCMESHKGFYVILLDEASKSQQSKS